MQENNTLRRKYIDVVSDETTTWKPDYNADDLNALMDDYGWIPFDRTNDDETIEHRLYNPRQGFVKYIKWVDRETRDKDEKFL